jgi:N-acetyl-anhydromuramyl-L-alanine amidase AmpD
MMSNSPLVNYTKISPNSSNPRRDKIKKITIHHMAGNLTVETCGNVFASASRKASSNYGIGTDGRVGMYVEEKNRAWTSSSAANDNQAVTIEVANDQIGGDWHVSDTALNKLIELCVDICKRNGIEKLIYTGDATGNLTRHNMFAATTCPGAYLQSKFPYIADEVNKRLNTKTEKPSTTLYRVQTGAFSVKSNANALEARLKKAGFDTYMVKVGKLYKVQVGAFSVRANAEAMANKLKKAGFDTYITTEKGTPVTKAV